MRHLYRTVDPEGVEPSTFRVRTGYSEPVELRIRVRGVTLLGVSTPRSSLLACHGQHSDLTTRCLGTGGSVCQQLTGQESNLRTGFPCPVNHRDLGVEPSHAKLTSPTAGCLSSRLPVNDDEHANPKKREAMTVSSSGGNRIPVVSVNSRAPAIGHHWNESSRGWV